MNDIAVFLYAASDPQSAAQRLAQAVKTFCELDALADVSLQYHPDGQPYLPQFPALSLSISHSGGLWGAALSSQSVGLDIEQVRENGMHAVARRFFHPQEYAYLCETNFADFFAVWTAKESYVKWTGEGITDRFSEFSVIQNGGIAASLNGATFRHVPYRMDYRICICACHIERITVYDYTRI